MSVNWIDLILFVTVILIVWLEFRRGFGQAILDFVALFVALKIAMAYSGQIATHLRFVADQQDNHAFIFATSFLVFAAALWFLGKLLYDTTLICLDSFDPPLGAILGLVIAVVIGHALMNTLYIASSAGDAVPDVIAGSVLGYSFLEFPAYHAVVDFMSRLTS